MRISLPNLQPNTAYAIELRSQRGNQYSEWSRKFTFTTAMNLAVPTTPGAVTWVVNGDGFHGEFQGVATNTDGKFTKIDHYEIELVGGAVTRYDAIITQDAGKLVYDLSYNDNIAMFGTAQATVTFRVRAVDASNLKSAWTTVVSATNPAPANVAGFTASAQYDAVALSWTANTDTDLKNYVVTYSSTGSSGTYTQIYSGTANSFLFPNTMYTTDLYFRVVAVDKFNTQSATPTTAGPVRPKSSFTVDTTAPGAPTGVTATAGFDSTAYQPYINVSWTAPSDTDIQSYVVRYGTTNGSYNYVTVSRDQTSVRLIPLSLNTSYYIGVAARDLSANTGAYATPTTNPVATVGNGTVPSTPAAPSVVSSTLQVQVSIPGTKAAGGNEEADVSYYDVYIYSTSGKTLTSSDIAGQIQAAKIVGGAMVGTFDVPATGGTTTQNWYVKIVAVNNSGLRSASSAEVTAAVGLIGNTNIIDATIQNAKIANLGADKIIAGSGFVNDLTVKSNFTLGDASTTGVIRSYDYVTSSGTTGFSFSKAGLVIKTGAISAAALLIQFGENIIQPLYADFEGTPASYSNIQMFNGSSALSTTYRQFSSQSLAWTANNSSGYFLLGNSLGTDSFIVNPGRTYIVSFYAMVPTTGTAQTLTPFLNSNTSATNTYYTYGSNQSVPANSTWARYSTTVVAYASGLGAAVFGLATSAAGIIYIDGIQVEEQQSSAITPSSWSPPSRTSIDGGLIRTGEIRSDSAYDVSINGVSQPAWSINTNGNAQFSNLIIRGNTIVGGASTDGSSSYIKSYNYIPNVTGWTIRADGYAEFRNLATNSITSDVIQSGYSATKLGAGTIAANIFLGANFIAQDTTSNKITVRQKTSNVVTLTTSVAHNRSVGDRVIVAIGDTAFDTPANSYDVLTAVSGTTVQYIRNGSDVASANVTGTATFFGRNATMNPAGLHLYGQDGVTPLIDLPTSPLQDAYFNGKIVAKSIGITDNMVLAGTNNVLASGSTLRLTSQIQPPTNGPSVSVEIPSSALPVTSLNTTLYAPRGGYTESGQFWMCGYPNNSPAVYKADLSTGAVSTVYLSGITNVMVGTDGGGNNYYTNVVPHGITKVGARYYVVGYQNAVNWSYTVSTYHPATGGSGGSGDTIYHPAYYTYQTYNGTFPAKWILASFTDSGLGTRENYWTFDASSDFGWQAAGADWTIYDYYPTIGTDGTYIWLSRQGGNGYTYINKYDNSMNKYGSTITTNLYNAHSLMSMNYGTFDFGANRAVFFTYDPAGAQMIYTIDTSTNQVVTNETYPPPYTDFWATGQIWDGTRFRSYDGFTNSIHTSSDFAKQTASTLWVAKATFYNTDATVTSITSKAVAGQALTLTAAAHPYMVGDYVVPSNVDTTVNGLTVPVTAVTSNTFTVTVPSGTATAGAVTGTSVRSTYETGFSPTTSFTISRRKALTLSTTGLPTTPGARDPKGLRFYISQDSGVSFYRQVSPANGVGTESWITAPATGTSQTVDTAFPAATPARVYSAGVDASGNSAIDFRGDGSYRLSGTNLDDVQKQVIGTTFAPAFQNSWTNYDGSTTSGRYAAFYKKNGVVFVQGCVKNGSLGASIFTLPTGCRPLADKVFTVNNPTVGAAINVQPNGAVYIYSTNSSGSAVSNSYVYLDGISFVSEQ